MSPAPRATESTFMFPAASRPGTHARAPPDSLEQPGGEGPGSASRGALPAWTDRNPLASEPDEEEAVKEEDLF
eukprot:2858126-Pyramimonas_sp.AAC.1